MSVKMKGKPPIKAEFVQRRLTRFPNDSFEDINAVYQRETGDSISLTTFRKVRDTMAKDRKATENVAAFHKERANGRAEEPANGSTYLGDVRIPEKLSRSYPEELLDEAEDMLDGLIFLFRDMRLTDMEASCASLRSVRRTVILNALRISNQLDSLHQPVE